MKPALPFLSALFLGSALICSASSANVLAQPAASPNQPPLPAEISREIASFFAAVKKGDNAGAIQGVLSGSPLWEKTAIKEQMNAQLDTATKLYGPLLSYECPVTYHTGTLHIRQYCFAQHQEIVLRWQFDFLKAGRGWMVSYFAFTDQSNGWPDQP